MVVLLWGCSSSVVDALLVMAFSSLSFEVLCCCLVGSRVEGLLHIAFDEVPFPQCDKKAPVLYERSGRARDESLPDENLCGSIFGFAKVRVGTREQTMARLQGRVETMRPVSVGHHSATRPTANLGESGRFRENFTGDHRPAPTRQIMFLTHTASSEPCEFFCAAIQYWNTSTESPWKHEQ